MSALPPIADICSVPDIPFCVTRLASILADFELSSNMRTLIQQISKLVDVCSMAHNLHANRIILMDDITFLNANPDIEGASVAQA